MSVKDESHRVHHSQKAADRVVSFVQTCGRAKIRWKAATKDTKSNDRGELLQNSATGCADGGVSRRMESTRRWYEQIQKQDTEYDRYEAAQRQ